MAVMILGLFENIKDANSVLSELDEHEYGSEEITVVVREDIAKGDVEIEENGTGDGAKEGAKTGGLIGGILGLLAGLAAIAIPGLGALFIAGPLVSALGIGGVAGTTAAGALTGALAGGLVGALVNLGVEEDKAKIYETRVKEGDILLGVNVRDGDESTVEQIMNDRGVHDLSRATLS